MSPLLSVCLTLSVLLFHPKLPQTGLRSVHLPSRFLTVIDPSEVQREDVSEAVSGDGSYSPTRLMCSLAGGQVCCLRSTCLRPGLTFHFVCEYAHLVGWVMQLQHSTAHKSSISCASASNSFCCVYVWLLYKVSYHCPVLFVWQQHYPF